MESDFGVKIRVGVDEFHVIANGFTESLLATILRLRAKGRDPFWVRWQYFDRDHVTDDLHRAFHFFLTWNDKIVEEDVALSDSHSSGFDPTILVDSTTEPIWQNHGYFDAATVKRNYRTFYSQTPTGQLMVLRDDEPPLFYAADLRWSALDAITIVDARLDRLARLVRWLIALSALSLFLQFT